MNMVGCVTVARASGTVQDPLTLYYGYNLPRMKQAKVCIASRSLTINNNDNATQSGVMLQMS